MLVLLVLRGAVEESNLATSFSTPLRKEENGSLLLVLVSVRVTVTCLTIGPLLQVCCPPEPPPWGSSGAKREALLFFFHVRCSLSGLSQSFMTATRFPPR